MKYYFLLLILLFDYINIFPETLRDTLIPGSGETGTSLISVENDSILINVIDSVNKNDNFIQDSIHVDTIIMHKSDSIELAKLYLIDKIEADTLINFDDSVKVIINSIIQYLNSKPVLSDIDQLKKYLYDSLSIIKDTSLTDSIFIINQDSIQYDSLLQIHYDSIINCLSILINQIEKDSVKLQFINNLNDSLTVYSMKNNNYNFRFRLADDNGEIVGLRIISNQKNLIKLQLEPGTLVKPIKERQTIQSTLPTTAPVQEIYKKDEIKFDLPQWNIGGVGSMNFNQGYISNWVQGGQSSISSLSVLKFNADYSKSKLKWDNDAEIKLGILGLVTESTDENQGKNRLDFRKNEDKFEINSKYGRNAFKKYYYSALFNVNSQFFPGYDYPTDTTRVMVSKFLSPGYFIFSLGLDYKPNNKFTLMASPLTSKITTVIDTANITNYEKYGLETGKKSKKEIGAYVKSIWKYDITKDILLENKLTLFTSYTKNPEKVDVDWEVLITAKISEYIIATINTHLIYDYDVKFTDEKGQTTDKVQFKEYFSIGFSYKFQNTFTSSIK